MYFHSSRSYSNRPTRQFQDQVISESQFILNHQQRMSSKCTNVYKCAKSTFMIVQQTTRPSAPTEKKFMLLSRSFLRQRTYKDNNERIKIESSYSFIWLTHTHTHTHTCTHTHTHTHTHNTHTHTHMHARTHTHTHTHANTNRHTYIHTNRQTSRQTDKQTERLTE